MRIKVNVITIIFVLLIVLGWILNTISLVYLIPIAIIYLLVNVIGSSSIKFNYFVDSYCKGITNEKEVSITFDDGPHSQNTPKLLSLLQEKNVSAAFFCTGEAVSLNSKIVKKAFSEGHIIANHTYYHSKFFDLFSSTRMMNEINCTNNEIYKIIGKKPSLFRPPYGVTNPMLGRALKRTKLTSIGWSVRSFDTILSSDDVLAKLKSKTHPGDIVLFHDTVPATISIVSEYLEWLEFNNYKVVSLTSLLNIPAYEV